MQELFPHVLTRPDSKNKGLLRFVTSDEVGPLEIIKEPIGHLGSSGYMAFKVDEIKEKRLAKGDWSKWPKHPYYYEATGRQI